MGEVVTNAMKRSRPAASFPRSGLDEDFGDGELRKRLTKCGVYISECDDCYVVPSAHELMSELSTTEIGSRVVTAIVDDLERAWAEERCFRRALIPFQTQKSRKGFLFGKDTLVKILLSVDALQTPLLATLMHKVPEVALTVDPGPPPSSAILANDVARLTVHQLRWLDFIVDGEQLAETLLSVVTACPEYLQKELIAVTPEIVDDAHHHLAIETLTVLLQENPELTGSVLDAIAGLQLGNQAGHCCDIVLRTLPSANVDDLAQIVRFIVRNTPPESMPSAVQTLRKQLVKPSLNATCAKLTQEALKEGLAERPDFADAVFKAVKASAQPDQTHPSDLWFLLALAEISSRQKQAELLFRRLVLGGAINAELISVSLDFFKEGISGLFRPLLSLASITLRSSPAHSHEVATKLYQILFQVSTRTDARRDVIGALLEHAGSKQGVESEVALDILVSIAREADLSPHASLLEGLLDFIDLFPVGHVRKIFSLLALVQQRNEEASTDNSLEILIRKELTHAEAKYRHIGVVAACSLLHIFSETQASLPRAKSLLTTLMASIESDSACEAKAYNELAVSCQEGHFNNRIVKALLSSATKVFEARFAVELQNPRRPSAIVPTEAKFNLDGEDATISIDVTSLVERSDGGNATRSDASVVCPLVRMLCEATKRLAKGSLQSIDAIIGCPLWLPSEAFTKDLEGASNDQKRITAKALLLGANWIRCTMSSFAAQQSKDLKHSVLQRVQNLLEVEETLEGIAENFPVCKDALQDLMKDRKAKWTQGMELLDPRILTLITSSANFEEDRNLPPELLQAAGLVIRNLVTLLKDKVEGDGGELSEGTVSGLCALGPILKRLRSRLAKEKDDEEQESGEEEASTEELRQRCLVDSYYCLATAIGHERTLPNEQLVSVCQSLRERQAGESSAYEEIEGKVENQVKATVRYLEGLTQRNLDCDVASLQESSSLIQVLASLASRSKATEVRNRVSLLAGSLLEEDAWTLADRKFASTCMAKVVHTRVSLANEKLTVLQRLIPPEERRHADVQLRAVTQELMCIVSEWKLNVDHESGLLLSLMATFFMITQRSRREVKAFGPLMRCGRVVAEFFNTQIAPFLEQRLETQRSDCLQIIKEFQGSTRVLQHLCSHAKVTRDSSLTTLVPGLKRALEKVIFQVKSVLQANNGLGAFWVGNLKHRNLDGEVVSSQIAQEPSGDEEEEEEGDATGGTDDPRGARRGDNEGDRVEENNADDAEDDAIRGVEEEEIVEEGGDEDDEAGDEEMDDAGVDEEDRTGAAGKDMETEDDGQPTLGENDDEEDGDDNDHP